MAAGAKQPPVAFDPASFRSFRFLARELAADGAVSLSYALDDELAFTERLIAARPGPARGRGDRSCARDCCRCCTGSPASATSRRRCRPRVEFAGARPAPGPAAAALLEALYSEGLGELAYTNRLASLPRPRFREPGDGQAAAGAAPAPRRTAPARALVPVGGGKDSAVAIEVVRRSGAETVLFSVGDAPPIARTADAAGLPRLIATRELDPLLFDCNAAGAINGHVPVTAIVTCVALLTAALNGFDTVAMANERSASAGNLRWDGVEINHQFSKGLAAERLLAAAVAETGAARQAAVGAASGLRARDRPRVRGHGALPRRLHELQRDLPHRSRGARVVVVLRRAPSAASCSSRWRRSARPSTSPRCSAPTCSPTSRSSRASRCWPPRGGTSPSSASARSRRASPPCACSPPRSAGASMPSSRRLAAEVLPSHPLPEGDPETVLALSGDHDLPPSLLDDLRAVLRA